MSSTHPILGQLILGYAPLIDRQRLVMASRLTVLPQRPELRLSGSELLAALADTFADPTKPAVLNVLSESLLAELLSLALPAHLWLEVPSFMVAEHAESIAQLHRQGATLLLKGLPSSPLAPPLGACFKQLVLDLDDARLRPPAELKAACAGLPLWLSGARGAADVDEAFALGATAVLGWPVDGAYEPPAGAAAKSEIQADLQVIVELMSRVDQAEDIDRIEQTLKRDPSLAFKLLRYMNSAAFGLPVEVSSFRHAIMLLGYARLKRWLALLLTTASKDHSMRPIMYGALRRGLMMEELARGMTEADMRDEMFICGLFSLLDHMLKQPFAKLLQSIPVPERVRQALVDHSGPYHPYLALVRATESESAFDIRDAAEALMLGAEEINHGVQRALAKAAQLE
ncbi:HDOD domain-containing protein [Paucibacter sp. APW11]|uniref:HDOD domain-containing protein n=1 Tax=Roseateles aquae TaxID=3077235 RepID=A0ABU3P9T5_9BURK|nr:HDOD domain-containing protein [Paucibacter sp. APW11]MDT8999317.1 HDOD domain-containing protein [Paucibacter sp. APW11]